MVNGRYDGDMLAETSVEPLFNRAREPKQIIWMDTGHQMPTADARGEIIAWLRSAMP